MLEEILLVENDINFRDSLVEALKDEFKFSVAESVPEAKNKLQARPNINIIILDLNLPGPDGIELLHSMQGSIKDRKVIVLTGHTDRLTASRATELGIFAYHAKTDSPNQAIRFSLSKAIASVRPLVFLSYIRSHDQQVRELYKQLQTHGLQPWMDIIDLTPGADWQYETHRVMQQADRALVVLSGESTTHTGEYQAELKSLLKIQEKQPQGKVFIIPVRLDNCIIPESINNLHTVDLFTADDFTNLVDALKAP